MTFIGRIGTNAAIWAIVRLPIRICPSWMSWLYYHDHTTIPPSSVPGGTDVEYSHVENRWQVNLDRVHPTTIAIGRYQGYGTACPRPFPWNCSTAGSYGGRPARHSPWKETGEKETEKEFQVRELSSWLHNLYFYHSPGLLTSNPLVRLIIDPGG